MVPFTKVQYFYAKEKEIESYVFYSQQSANVCCGVEFLEIPFGAQLRWQNVKKNKFGILAYLHFSTRLLCTKDKCEWR